MHDGRPASASADATSTDRAKDALKYAAAMLRCRVEAATDSITGADFGGEHADACDVINGTIGEVREMAAQFGHPHNYSDGRRVTTTVEIERGFHTEHVWHPDASQETPQSWGGTLPSGSGLLYPGSFVVQTDPVTQTVHVTVARTA